MRDRGARRQARGRPGLTLLLLVTLLLGAACADGAPAATTEEPRTVRVFAASSLSIVAPALERAFEANHSSVSVTFTFGGSSALARQIADGAPADVLLAADEESARPLVEAGTLDSVAPFATNVLAVIVEAGNPRRIRSLADLAPDDVLVALCAPEVPCGRLARGWLAASGVEVDAVTLEENVRGVVAKVALGEADAGIAYVTDATSAAGVERAQVAEDDVAQNDGSLQARYVAGAVNGAPDGDATPSDVEAWLTFLLADEAQAVLRRAGFGSL